MLRDRSSSYRYCQHTKYRTVQKGEELENCQIKSNKLVKYWHDFFSTIFLLNAESRGIGKPLQGYNQTALIFFQSRSIQLHNYFNIWKIIWSIMWRIKIYICNTELKSQIFLLKMLKIDRLGNKNLKNLHKKIWFSLANHVSWFNIFCDICSDMCIYIIFYCDFAFIYNH